MTTRMAAVLAASLILAACAPVGSGAAPLDGTWRLESGTDDGETIPIVDGAPITMTIDGSSVGGTAACNQYGGDISVDGNSATIGAMAMTEMACDEPVMRSEAAYVAALGAVESFERTGDRLFLRGGDVELAYRLVPRAEDAPLVGPTWVLDSVISGDAVASTLGQRATLEFRDDGTFSGSTGCRAFDGRYEAADRAVEVSGLAHDDRACPSDVAAQDEHVLAVLADGFTYDTDGDRLTLTAGDRGLGYVAAAE